MDEQSDDLDPRRLSELYAIERRGVPGYVAALVGAFLTDAPRRLQQLRAAHERGEGPLLQEDAHILRSAAATVGARALAQLCAQLEAASKAGRLAEVGALLDALAERFAQVEPALTARLQRGTTP